MKKAPLRTSKDIYDRLKWDNAIPAESVWIGYEDRMAGMREIPFADFRPGGRIPWARLQYFRLEDQRIWDRQTRLDRVFGSGDTTAEERLDAQVSKVGFGNGFISRDVWRWEPLDAIWEPAHKAPIQSPESIKVLTFNILRTDFDGDRIPHTERIQAILAHLKASDADIIALQEVQSEFYTALLSDPWFRDGWFFSDGPEPETLGDLGILILSRLRPVQVLEFRFPDLRPAIVMRIETEEEGADNYRIPGPALHVVSVHLPSNRRGSAHLLRQDCLDQLAAALPEGDAVILAGDFNFSDDGPEKLPRGYRDLWREFKPRANGATFDPQRNPIATMNSRRGIPLRLDRILLRDPDVRFFPQSIEMTGTETYARARWLSDHFGLAAEFVMDGSSQSLTSVGTTHRSAVCIIPPPELQAEIQALRRFHDDRFERWMPHINLLYGFLPESMFNLSGKVLREALADIPPFEFKLEKVEAFHHGKSDTLWLSVDDQGMTACQALQRKLIEYFPQCTEQNRRGKYTPHLSLGKFRGEDRKTLSGRQREWNNAWSGLKFKVDRIFLISRRGEEPFEVREEILLQGENEKRSLPDLETALGMRGWLPGSVELAARERVWQAIEKAHGQAAGALGLEKVGSAGLGTDLSGGDLDLLASGTLPRGMYYAEMEALLQGIRPDIQMRRVDDALVPLLKIRLKGLEVDLLYSGPDADDETNVLSRSGAEEIQCLQAKLGGTLPKFTTVVRALKAFAKTCQISDHAFGWPGGLAWTVLVAAFQPEKDSFTSEEWLEHVLEHLAIWDWSRALKLSEEQLEKADAAMQIHSCALPEVNITRNVTAGNLEILKRHALEGWEIAHEAGEGKRSWTDLFHKPAEDFPASMEIRLQASSDADLENVKGWMRRHVLSLILHWEANLTLGLRAFSDPLAMGFETPGRLSTRFVLGISQVPDNNQQQSIHELLSEMEEKFIGWDVRPLGSKMISQLHTP